MLVVCFGNIILIYQDAATVCVKGRVDRIGKVSIAQAGVGSGRGFINNPDHCIAIGIVFMAEFKGKRTGKIGVRIQACIAPGCRIDKGKSKKTIVLGDRIARFLDFRPFGVVQGRAGKIIVKLKKRV